MSSTGVGDVACPQCGAAIASGDTFCEACGTALVADAVAAAAVAAVLAAAAAPVDPDRAGAGANVSVPGPCVVCGGVIDDDGFCGTCGQKARTERDHWIESPAVWVGGVCDKGIVHSGNEDAMALAATPFGDRTDARAVLVVCDGVTSAPHSDRASIAAVRAACAALVAAPPPAADDPFPAQLDHWQRHLGVACAAANVEAVAVARVLGDPPEPPSCTFVAAIVAQHLVSVAWCGDSRAYWIPDAGEGEELSTDHSIGTELMRAGATREIAEADPASHTITRWLGADSVDPTPEYVTRRLDDAGWVVVCSDGMWNYASTPQALGALLTEAGADGATGPTALAESLAAWANDQGGHDNITVALARHERQVP